MDTSTLTQSVPGASGSSGGPGDSSIGAGEAEGELSPGQERAIVALLTSSTHAAAVEAAGVTARTLRRWFRSDLAFRQRLREEIAPPSRANRTGKGEMTCPRSKKADKSGQKRTKRDAGTMKGEG